MGRKVVIALAALALISIAPTGVIAKVRVVGSIGILAAIASELGGAGVEVESLVTGLEDPHTFEPRVSDVRKVAAADLLVVIGLGLEEWLEGLVANSGNDDLIKVVASAGVEVIDDGAEDHEEEGRHHEEEGHHHQEEGHHHALGNPHVWLDPTAGAKMGNNIVGGLTKKDPESADEYAANLAAFIKKLGMLKAELTGRVDGLEDKRFISYHPAWPYLARGFGFELVDVVTPLPGQEPSPKRLARLIELIRNENIRVLVTEPQLGSEIPALLAEETNITVISLSPLIVDETGYAEFLRETVGRLVEALEKTVR